MTPYLLILAVLLGIAPGLIAHSKGRNFLFWWIYGVFLGPIALLHAILLRQKPNAFYATDRFAAVSQDRQRPPRWRIYWPMALWGAASVAIAIVAVAAYGLLSPERFAIPGQQRDVSISADRAPAADRQATVPSPTRGLVVDKPAAEQPKTRDEPPTVRVTIRHDKIGPPPERLARAPAMPVERIKPKIEPKREPAAAQSLERAKPPSAPPAVPAPSVKASPAPSPTGTPATEPNGPKALPPKAVASLPAKPNETEAAKATPATAAPPKSDDAAPSAAAVAPTKTPPAKPAKPAAEQATNVTAVGETVQIVQLTLAKKGYDPGPANGRAGIKTQTAIRKFQSDRGLRPTGAIDYDLLEKLGIVGPRVHAFRPPPGATPGR